MDSSGLKEDIFYSSSWMQEILEISNIGLWLLEINKNNTDVRPVSYTHLTLPTT